MAAVADAGIKQIDYLVSTHYHVDHIGNLVEVAKRIPVGTFVDHGPTVEGPDVTQIPPGPDGLPITKPREQIEGFQAAYAELYFTDKTWPDFAEDDVDAAIFEFGRRKRKFGGL
jgi:glyoxylase-like metal-dependent hydrolase (beta-lactamase superfamily II)